MALRIGEIFLNKKLLNQQQLEMALQEQGRSGKFLGEILVKMGFVHEDDLLQVLAEQFNTRFVSQDSVQINPLVIKMVPFDLVAEYQFMPVEVRNGVLLIAVSNPLDMWPLSVLQKKMALTEVQVVLATKTDIQQQLEKYYSGTGHG